MVQLAKALDQRAALDDVPGLARYHDNGDLNITPPAVIKDTTQLPNPALDLIDQHFYRRGKTPEGTQQAKQYESRSQTTGEREAAVRVLRGRLAVAGGPGPWLSLVLGLGWLRPHALFGIEGLDPVVHAILWSLLLTATAVMQLVGEGTLSLGRDVNDYLEVVQLPASWPRPVTLADLLTHTAGFEQRAFGFYARRAGDAPGEAPAASLEKFPHLAEFDAYTIDVDAAAAADLGAFTRGLTPSAMSLNSSD